MIEARLPSARHHTHARNKKKVSQVEFRNCSAVKLFVLCDSRRGEYKEQGNNGLTERDGGRGRDRGRKKGRQGKMMQKGRKRDDGNEEE